MYKYTYIYTVKEFAINPYAGHCRTVLGALPTLFTARTLGTEPPAHQEGIEPGTLFPYQPSLQERRQPVDQQV
jgi:hypothetical protein